MDRRELVDEGDRWIGWVQTTPDLAGGWHHHGDRDTYIFMTSGLLTVDFGPGGRESITMSAGDCGFVPPRTVHRETTGPGEGATAFLVRLGTGPQNVNVDGPDPG
jgi:mannose-6-phosphate isomerase-like protein (cupin superfamily)